jgi:cell division transport system permease protein
MLAWLNPSPAERRLLTAARGGGATPWLIAIMSFAMVIVAAAGLALANAAASVSAAAEHRYSVVAPGGSDVAALARLLGSAPGVTNIEAVPEARMRGTLARWLGPEAANGDLPVPAMIHFDLSAGSDPNAVARRIHAVAPAATINAHGSVARPLLRSLDAVQGLALALVLLLSGATAAAIGLAARGALDTHRSTIEVMHGIGATDLQVTHLFQRKIALEALLGSVGGAAVAALIIVALIAGASFVEDLGGGRMLSAVDIVLLALLPIALTLLATWVARTAVLSALRRTL